MPLSKERARAMLEARLSQIGYLKVGIVEQSDEQTFSATILDFNGTCVLDVRVDRDSGSVIGWK
jgi:hypothetical protein